MPRATTGNNVHCPIESDVARAQRVRSVEPSCVAKPQGPCTLQSGGCMDPRKSNRQVTWQNMEFSPGLTLSSAYGIVNRETTILKKREYERKCRANRKTMQENYVRKKALEARLDDELGELVKQEMNAWTKEHIIAG